MKTNETQNGAGHCAGRVIMFSKKVVRGGCKVRQLTAIAIVDGGKEKGALFGFAECIPSHDGDTPSLVAVRALRAAAVQLDTDAYHDGKAAGGSGLPNVDAPVIDLTGNLHTVVAVNTEPTWTCSGPQLGHIVYQDGARSLAGKYSPLVNPALKI